MRTALRSSAAISVVAMGLALLPKPMLFAQAATLAPEHVRTVLTTPLPRHMQGDSLRTTLITVRYGPGEASPSHTHSCPVIVYVLEGKIRSQIGGQQEVIYGPGESFYEPPGGLHTVSANASDQQPARFLAFFICDRDVPLSSGPPSSAPGKK